MGKRIRNLYTKLIENDLISISFILFYILFFYCIFLPDYQRGGIAYPTTIVGTLLFMLYIYRMYNPHNSCLINKIATVICAITAKGLLIVLGIFCFMGAWNFLDSLIILYILMSLWLLIIFSAKRNRYKCISHIKYFEVSKNMVIFKSIISILACLYLLKVFQSGNDVIKQSIIYLLPFAYIFASKSIINLAYFNKKNIIIELLYYLLLNSVIISISTKIALFYYDKVNPHYNSETMKTFILILFTIIISFIKLPNKK